MEMRKEMHLGRRLDHAFCDLCLTANTNGVILAYFLHELVLRHGFGGVVYMKALRLERADSILADIFEQQESEALVLDRV